MPGRAQMVMKKTSERRTADEFHRLYYARAGKTWGATFFLGVQTWKLPLDLWIYQEIIYSLKPDVIIETGTYHGGSALYLATVCDAVQNGLVITIDTRQKVKARVLRHRRIRCIQGSSVDQKTVSRVRKLIPPRARVLVMLDSDHSKAHVLRELEIYSKLVSRGSYLIVEDTNVNGHPVFPEFGPGPLEAVRSFLRKNKRFKSDRSMEKFYVTFNPGGYLQRTS